MKHNLLGGLININVKNEDIFIDFSNQYFPTLEHAEAAMNTATIDKHLISKMIQIVKDCSPADIENRVTKMTKALDDLDFYIDYSEKGYQVKLK